MGDPKYKLHSVDVPWSGSLNVVVEGKLEERHGKTFFVTVHDVGTNHKSWRPLLDHELMTAVRQHAIFLHVCVPGQEDKAENLPENFKFPTLDELAKDITAVVDHFKVKTVIAMGEGVGANIIARFAMLNPNRILGVILIHCTSTTAGLMEYISDKFINYKLTSVGMNASAWSYLVSYKFGPNASEDDPRSLRYLDDLKRTLNANNLSLYLNSFLQRTDICGTLCEKLTTDALLIVGAKASHLHSVNTMQQAMNKRVTTLLQVDDVGDCLTEAPHKVARALILFSKGLGALSGVGIPGLERQKTLSGSMEEADRPRRLSTAKADAVLS